MRFHVTITDFGTLSAVPREIDSDTIFVLRVEHVGQGFWTVYRSSSSFQRMYYQLSMVYGTQAISAIPEKVNDDRTEHMCQEFSDWLQHLLRNDAVSQSQFVVHFLSADANVTPHNYKSSTMQQSIGDMNMDDMFDLPEEDSHIEEIAHVVSHNRLENEGAFKKEKVNLEDFKLIKVIGKGSFGKVLLVRKLDTNSLYAMKVLRKENIIKRNQVEHTRTERQVLGYVRHPFIVGLNYAFQTSEKLYFVLDYCAGGELFFHLGKVSRFTECRARFYAAEITLAIEYVHNLEIIYRDLKPENVLLDASGHIRLTDFGLSKEGIQDDFTGANSFCGTPEYLAPEILNRSGHGRAVDWWSLGALLYEMLTGLPPFYCRDRDKLFEKIRCGELTYPKYLSASAKNLLGRLLERDPTKRLGTGIEDAGEIKNHPFFEGIQWDALMRGELAPPWRPIIASALDTSQFDREFTEMPIVSPDTGIGLQTNGRKVASASVRDRDLFHGFTYTEESYMENGNSSDSRRLG